jgi:cystathionine beta-lyase
LKIKFLQNACGAILSPFESWLLIRGIETLHLRVKQHCMNAQVVAEWLSGQPHVDKIFYPGLPTHHNHEIAKRQSKGFGGIVSFTLKEDTDAAAIAFVTGTKYFLLAESLGGIKSLISHPANMTHKSIPAAIRRANGVNDSLIRLSVGLEEVEDLIADLDQAFTKINNTKKPVSKKLAPQLV